MGFSREEHWSGLPMPSSRGSSQSRDQTQISHSAGRFLYQLSYQGSPRVLKCFAVPFSRASSPPSDQTGVSGIADGFFVFFFFSFRFLQMDSLPAEPPGKPLDSDQTCSQLKWTVHTALPAACCCSQQTGQDEMPESTSPPLWAA